MCTLYSIAYGIIIFFTADIKFLTSGIKLEDIQTCWAVYKTLDYDISLWIKTVVGSFESASLYLIKWTVLVNDLLSVPSYNSYNHLWRKWSFLESSQLCSLMSSRFLLDLWIQINVYEYSQLQAAIFNWCRWRIFTATDISTRSIEKLHATVACAKSLLCYLTHVLKENQVKHSYKD